MKRITAENWSGYYMSVWKRALAEFRGWSEAEVEAWARQNEHLQDDGELDEWVSHWPVSYWIDREVIPVELWEKTTPRERLDLCYDVGMVLWPGQYVVDGIEPDEVDWPEIKRNVAAVLRQWEKKI